MEHKFLIFLFVALVCISSVNAIDDLGYARLNQPYNVSLGCSYNGTFCPSTFFCNVTVHNPNTAIVNNQPMSNTSWPQYNYTIPANIMTVTGLYTGGQVCCGPGAIGCSDDYTFQIHVNAQGKDNANDGITYVAMFIFLLLVFAGSLYAFIVLPFDNPRNENDEVISVDYKKYLKIAMFLLAYVCFVGISYFAWNISYGILEFTEMANFFYFLFRTTFIIGIGLMFVVFIFVIIRFVKDKITEKNLLRGLTVK